MSLSLDAIQSEGGLLSIESHRSVPAPFLTKTYRLVDDPSTDHIVSWGEEDTTLVVWRPPEFARDLLPNYFKHNNFSSFVRQLNTYGFRKVMPYRWEFSNDFFRRGQTHLLCEIHRRKSLQASNLTSPINSGDDNYFISTWSPVRTSSLMHPVSSTYRLHHLNSITSLSTSKSIFPRANHHLSHELSALSLALLDDNDRLRRNNNLLLSEISRIRKLYNEILPYLLQSQLENYSYSYSTPSQECTLAPLMQPARENINAAVSIAREEHVTTKPGCPTSSGMLSFVNLPLFQGKRSALLLQHHASTKDLYLFSSDNPLLQANHSSSSFISQRSGFTSQLQAPSTANDNNTTETAISSNTNIHTSSQYDIQDQDIKTIVGQVTSSPSMLFGVALHDNKKRPHPYYDAENRSCLKEKIKKACGCTQDDKSLELKQSPASSSPSAAIASTRAGGTQALLQQVEAAPHRMKFPSM